MSDMELSVPGEEGVPSEECDGGEEGEEESSGGPRPAHFGRQGDEGRRDSEHRRMVDITRDKPVKVTVRVAVPVRDHPKFNFVGKLLGPKGNSLKRLQEDTMTKMAILGRGSMKDKHKEEELRTSGDPKFSHLHDDLHVEITAFAPPAEAHARIAYALADVRRFLVPDYNDDIRQEQMWEMQILKERPEDISAANDGLGIRLAGAAIPIVPTVAETPSPSNSIRSQSPRTPPPSVLNAGPAVISARHPAPRGVALDPAVGGSAFPWAFPGVRFEYERNSLLSGTVAGRKRPFHSGSKHSVSPTKRTVMSILARARAAQAKQIPGYQIPG